MSDRYTIKGELTMATVPGLFEKEAPSFSGGMLTIDMSAVEHTDSAGLALLLEWVKQGTQQNTQVVLAHVPPQLQSMINVSGLDQLLVINE